MPRLPKQTPKQTLKRKLARKPPPQKPSKRWLKKTDETLRFVSLQLAVMKVKEHQRAKHLRALNLAHAKMLSEIGRKHAQFFVRAERQIAALKSELRRAALAVSR